MEDEAKHEILEAISLLAYQVQDLSNDVVVIKATMVTKSYLDDKLGDLKGDMVSMLRMEDQQVGRFVEVLTDKKVLTAAESKDVRSFRPFQ